MTYDVGIVGGGIVGLATALALTERNISRVLVLEAEERLAQHQTGHNSGVIHSGLYYKPGSLKAKNCVAGREAMYRFCVEHGVPHETCGKIVVATSFSELPALEELERRGQANGLVGLRRLRPDEISEREPYAQGVAALYVPQTGIVDFVAVAHRYAELVRERGGDIQLGARVLGVSLRSDGLTLITSRGEWFCRFLVNCAGLQCDRVARMCGVEPEVRIIPFRGEYYELIPERRHLVRHLIYPVPDARFPFLGVHLTRTIHGSVEAGPNAVLAFRREGYSRLSFSAKDLFETITYPGFWRMVARYGRTGVEEFYRSWSRRAFVRALQRLVPSLRKEDVRPGGAGVRAQAVSRDGRLVDDFRLLEAERMVHVLNAPSPAATASLSIGQTIAERVRARGI